MSVTITDKEPKAEVKAQLSPDSLADPASAAASCFEKPTLGQALRDGRPGDIDYVNSFLHLLAQQQKLRKEQVTLPTVATEEGSSDDDESDSDDDYRRRRGWKKRKLIWKDTYPPLKKGVRKKNRYKRRRSKDASVMQHSLLQSLQTGVGGSAPVPLPTNDAATPPPGERLRDSSMPDVRDMMSPAVVVALESQQQQQQQQQQPHQVHPLMHTQPHAQHHPAPSVVTTTSHFTIPLQTAASQASMHHLMSIPGTSMAMGQLTKSDFDELAMLEQSLLMQQSLTSRCAPVEQHVQHIAEEIMAEGRHAQLPAGALAALNTSASLFQHAALLPQHNSQPPHPQQHQSQHTHQHHQQHHQQQMWQRAMHALPDGGAVPASDEHVDEFYGQRLWATFEDIFDTEAMAGIEESLQTASIQAHVPSLAGGATPNGLGGCKSGAGVAATKEIWEEFFSNE